MRAQHLLNQRLYLVLDGAAGVLAEVLVEQFWQQPGVGVEGRVDLRLEALRDLLRAFVELGLNFVRLPFKLGFDEFGVGSGLFALEDSCADFNRLTYKRIEALACRLAFARQRNCRFVVDGEAVDQQLIA